MAITLPPVVARVGLDTSEVEQGVSKGMSGLTAAAAAAGAAVAAGIGAGIVRNLNIDKANDKLAAQLDLTADESERIGGVAGALYADAYGDSIEDVNAAVGAVQSTLGRSVDLSSADLERLSAKALDLAATFEVDVNEATRGAGSMIRNGLAADADEAFDLIVASMQQVPAGMRDEMLPVIEEYGPLFASLGYTGEEAMGLLVDASEGGVIALDKTADALKELTIRGTDMSAASVEAYEAAGLSAEEMADKLLAGGDDAREATAQIAEGLLSIEDPAERSNAAIALMGTPLEDLSVSEIPAFLGAMADTSGGLENVEGAADRMGDTLNDNAATKIEGYKRSLQGIVTGLVEIDGPIGAVAGGVAAFGGAAIGAIAPLGSMVAAMFTARTAAASTAATSNAASGSMVAGWVRSAGAAVANAARHVAAWVLVGIQALANAARVAAAWLIAMGPIALVIAAVVGLVALIVANWDKIVEWTRRLAEKVVGFLTGMRDRAVAAVQALRDRVVGFVTNLRDRVVTNVTDLRDKFVSRVTELRDRVVGAVTNLRDRVVGFVTNLRDRAVAIVRAMRDAYVGAIRNLVDTVVGSVSGFVGRIVGFFTSIRDRVSAAATAAKERVVEAFARIVTGASEKVSDLLGFVRDLPARILRGLGNVGRMLYNAGKSILEGLWRGIKSVASKPVDAVKNVAGRIRDLLPGSPVKDGPLRVLNRGYAGGQIASMIAGGIEDNVGKVAGAATRVAAAAVPDVADVRVGSLTGAGLADVGRRPAGGSRSVTIAAGAVQVSVGSDVQAGTVRREVESAFADLVRRLEAQ